MPITKDPRAVALCDDIRTLFAINHRDGWIASPHHTRRHIQVGHKDYGQGNPDIDIQVDALATAIEHLGLAERIGYTLVRIGRS